jgi:hypothetical protein
MTNIKQCAACYRLFVVGCVLLLCLPTFLISFQKIFYSFSNDPIDVVIPCHVKDAPKLDRTIEAIQTYVVGVRRIIVVSEKPFTHKAEWFDERLFPFSKEKLAREICKSAKRARKELRKSTTRIGWLYQQFLKLYAPFCVPGISSNVLIVDADVIFLKPVTFIQDNGAGLYAVGDEHHNPYFVHAEKVLPGLRKLHKNYSGVVHHMLFQRVVLVDLFNLIRAHHHVEPWIAMARFIELDKHKEIINSAMSEYEIYFNFVFARTDQVQIRHLTWNNIHEYELKKYTDSTYDYVAIHSWWD